jgi:uncharacterized protein YggT (Ycf19 family)
MLYQIISFLLDVAVGLLGGACLLRLYMQWQRVPFGNPVGRFVFALTDWLVLPLRRVLPPMGRLDTASLVGAFVLELAQYAVLWLLGVGTLAMLPLLALFRSRAAGDLGPDRAGDRLCRAVVGAVGFTAGGHHWAPVRAAAAALPADDPAGGRD